jgi:hypothetical protein
MLVLSPGAIVFTPTSTPYLSPFTCKYTRLLWSFMMHLTRADEHTTVRKCVYDACTHKEEEEEEEDYY